MQEEDRTASGGESPQEPTRLGGRYELGAVLGHGGMAVVRLGTDIRLGRTVAVKMLRGELAETPTFQVRFRREARAAASLNHHAIVSVYDAGEETIDGVVTLYIVMEYVEGQTLRDVLQSGPCDPDRALEITAGVLDALADSHRSGIIHRDVKPSNVMVTPSGAVKVMDFGVARAVADQSAALTQTSTVIGTAHYLSPEQARGDSVDARSDVYSTGCLLYELLTGRPPFQGDSALAVAYQHVREAPQPPSTFAQNVSPAIDAIVLRALAKRPDERYESAAKMRSDVHGVLTGDQSVVAMPPADTTAELGAVTGLAAAAAADSTLAGADEASAAVTDTTEQARSRRRRRTIGLVVAALAVVAAAALGGFALSGDDTPGRGQQAQQGVDTTPDESRTPREGGSLEPAGSTVAPTGAPDFQQEQGSGNRAGPGVVGTGESAGPGRATRQPQQAQPSQAPNPRASEPAPERTTRQEPTPSETQSESPRPDPSTTEEPTPTETSTPAEGPGS